MLGLTVEQSTSGYLDIQHLLKAERLGAELHLVAVTRLGLAVLIVNRKGHQILAV